MRKRCVGLISAGLFSSGFLAISGLQSVIAEEQPAKPAISSAPAQEFSTELSSGIVVYIDRIQRATGSTVQVQGRIVNPTSRPAELGSIMHSKRIVVRLQELESKRQYEPVYAESNIVGSEHDYHRVEPQGFVKFWTRVSAPPETVKEVTVVLPGDGSPIDNVPIEK